MSPNAPNTVSISADFLPTEEKSFATNFFTQEAQMNSVPGFVRVPDASSPRGAAHFQH
jgi:hypothetical protein